MASRQAVPNRQACRATGTALTRMSRTSTVVTTGIGITVTGIDKAVSRRAGWGAEPSLRWSIGYFGLPSYGPRQPFSLFGWSHANLEP
jgi:hypothetical protein